MDNGREQAEDTRATTDHPARVFDTPPVNNPPTAVISPTGPRPAQSSVERLDDDAKSVPEPHRHDANDRGYNNPLPPLPRTRLPADNGRDPVRTRTLETQLSAAHRSGLDWIVPVEEKPVKRLSIGERLQPTLDMARIERDKYAAKSKMTGYALNAAIGIQVLLGALTTGLSAALPGKQAAIVTTVLGGVSTVTASYLARARGSNEPELSITRVKDLEQFIRECQAFQMDNGHIYTRELDDHLNDFRDRFEELLGNANGERKLSPLV